MKFVILHILLAFSIATNALPHPADVQSQSRDVLASLDTRDSKSEFSLPEELWKRKGGGGGGGKGGGSGGSSSGGDSGGSSSGGSSSGGSSSGGSSSGGSSSGGSSSGGSSSGGSSSSGSSSLDLFTGSFTGSLLGSSLGLLLASSLGSSGGSSSSSGSGRGSGSSSSSTGGRTSTGSGVAPTYGRGYYGGGASVPYTSGARSASGISPIYYLGAGAFAVFPALWLYSVYSYPYTHPYGFYNATARMNETKPVNCLCQEYSECGCDENGDNSQLDQLIGNGSYSALNQSIVTVADINGTSTILINGTLPNGTTAAGGTDSPNSAASFKFSGYWLMIALVGCTVFLT